MPPKKINNIQALRGAAVLLVVFFHMTTIEKKYGGSQTLLPEFLQFGMFGVDLFFVISGFVMVTVTRGKFQYPAQALTFLYHRVSRIYPLYWFYSLLILALFLLHPSLVNSSQGNLVNIPASFLLFPQQHLPLLMVGWTLVHEVYFYLVFFLLLFLPERFLLTGLAIWTTAVVLLHSRISPGISPALDLISHPLTLEFIGGCLLAVICTRRQSRLPARLSLAVALLIFIAAVIGYMFHWQATGLLEPPGWQRILIMGVPALLIVYLVVQAELKNLVLPGPLCRIGDISYSVYLSHVLTLNLVGRIWATFATDTTADNWLVLPLMLLTVIAVGFISYTRVERPLIVLSRKIA